GCVMFTVSLVRLPLNSAVAGAWGRSTTGALGRLLLLAFPSFTAGLFEESARFAAFRLLIRERNWETGVMYGAGHGGFESMALVGLSVVSTVVAVVLFPSMIPPGQLQAIAAMPAYLLLVGLYERLAAITIQIGLSVLVLQCFIHMRLIYLALAVAIHFAIDFVALALLRFGILWPELAATAFALASYLYTMRKRPARAS
ncbi:MAG: YhfC family glutamic-type intramembrane protease, partial [Candidatus Bathyarchaeia archaeon]